MSADLLEIAEKVAGTAHAGEQVEAYVVRTRDTDVAVFGGQVESLTTASVEGVGIRVVADHRQGLAWAGSLDPDVIEETLKEARDNATFGEPDEWYGFATPADLDGITPPDLDLWRDELAAVPIHEKVRIALDLERATKAADPRIRNVESAGYGDAFAEIALANSLGVTAQTRRTTCSASAVALADDGSGTQSGYGFVAGRTLSDLDLDSIPRDAATRACRLLGAKPAAGRRIPVILDPLVTRSVLGVLSSAFNGESMLKGRSLFANRVGEKIGAPFVQLIDDPTDARALGASQFDGDGIPTRRNTLVVDGVMQGFLHNVYTGRRSGSGTTASATRSIGSTPGVGVRALRLEPGPRSVEEIMKIAGEAFYVQSVSGLHSGTNPISGDFSVGAEGLMVRGGAFAEPVREVTIASTLQRMLLEITEVGRDLVFLPGAVAGMTVLVGEMTMSGGRRPYGVPRRSRIDSSSASAGSGSITCTASIPNARAAATLSALSSRKTASPGVMFMRAHVERVDLDVGLAHPDVRRVDDLLAQLVDREHGAPAVAELLHVVRQQADAESACLELADLVHDRPVHARRRLLPESAVRVHVDRLTDDRGRLFDHALEIGRDVEPTFFEEMPVGLIFDFALDFGCVGIGGDRRRRGRDPRPRCTTHRRRAVAGANPSGSPRLPRRLRSRRRGDSRSRRRNRR